MIRRSAIAVGTALLALSLTAGVAIVAPSVAAAAEPCRGTWDVVVGGLTNNESVGFLNEDQRVGYNSFDTRSGVKELDRLIRAHARACPRDFIHPVGFSGGAAVVHLWATENGREFRGKASIVLIGDPKSPAGPGGGRGFAATDMRWVPALGGADDDYGGLPALQVCNGRISGGDHICNSGVSWDGYLLGVHGDYDFDVNAYPINADGAIFR
ncbi:cutinase family protein [Rhodococcus sp. WS4]|nr:cutinase family protein [Rhodococcus sp. WS4]